MILQTTLSNIQIQPVLYKLQMILICTLWKLLQVMVVWLEVNRMLFMLIDLLLLNFLRMILLFAKMVLLPLLPNWMIGVLLTWFILGAWMEMWMLLLPDRHIPLLSIPLELIV